MEKEIIVDINPYQTRVVLLEDGLPSEVYIECRGRERLVGNIYKGKVQNVLPGMQAAFVDIGLERNAFLYAGDIQMDRSDFTFSGDEGEIRQAPLNIRDIVKPGQEVMVQIVKEPVGTKGARVTTNITLPGRSLVLMPSVNYVGVSRRIENEEERSRLKGMLDDIAAEHNMGVIVRTAAEGKTEEEFIEMAAKRNIRIYGLSEYYIQHKERDSATILLGYALLTETEIRDATKRLIEEFMADTIKTS